ncbi:MAG TPA: lysyl oxidase family protein [Candidatus Nanopelagicales bacterium]|nr:lysyl oxidase family protein [Candidatus Nanopelagicales bacterium]
MVQPIPWIRAFRAARPAPLLITALAIAACSPPPDAAPPVGVAASSALQCGAPKGGPPFLTDEPACVLTGDASLGGCIGGSVAIGDVNGDGRPDLVAGLTRCNGVGPASGRLAIFPGANRYFSSQPVIVDLDWQNPSPSTSARGLAISVGETNGDGFADLLVRSRYGVQVFAGQANLAAAIAAPVFRVPGSGTFGAAEFDDVNGDGLSDLLSVKASVGSVFLATPGTASPPFALTRTLPAFGATQGSDHDDDGKDDLLLTTSAGVALYTGCAPGSAGCDGGISSEPLWVSPNRVLGLLPDQNGDGLREPLLGEPLESLGTGRIWLHLSDPQAGGISPMPIWAAIADPLFYALGVGLVSPGDLNLDGRDSDFLIQGIGRLYAFFPPPQGVSTALEPAWAWPRSDRLTDLYGGQVPLVVAPAGDLDGDNYQDLAVGLPYNFDAPGFGEVLLLSGGKVPPPPNGAPPPYLPEAATCGLGAGGLPDLTIDGDVLARSLEVRQKTFTDGDCELAEACVDAPGLRRLLRFSVAIANLGAGPMVIPGPEESPDLYYFDACHFHFHLTDFASYELRDASGELVRVGRKQGFYLMDIAPYCTDSPPGADYYPSQGVSQGWADIYTNDLPCQWLDITDTPDGTYTLRVSANDDGLVEEQGGLPNFAEVTVQLAGDTVTVLP